MSFSEDVKLEAKRKAAFSCCWCQQNTMRTDVHHIIPEADDGPDDLDNAAALCPGCHSMLGANPDMRKELRSRRDWWYEVVASKYGVEQSAMAVLQKVDGRLDNMERANQAIYADVKTSLSDLAAVMPTTFSPATAITGTVVASATTAVAAAAGMLERDPDEWSEAELMVAQPGYCPSCHAKRSPKEGEQPPRCTRCGAPLVY